MAPLVHDCLIFIAQNLQEIIDLPLDLNCMSSALIKKLASKVKIDELNQLKDKKDKLTSKLYMKKLELIFEDRQNLLNKCIHCDELFTKG